MRTSFRFNVKGMLHYTRVRPFLKGLLTHNPLVNGCESTASRHGRSSDASGVPGSLAVHEDDKLVGCPGVRPARFQNGKPPEGVCRVTASCHRHVGMDMPASVGSNTPSNIHCEPNSS